MENKETFTNEGITPLPQQGYVVSSLETEKLEALQSIGRSLKSIVIILDNINKTLMRQN